MKSKIKYTFLFKWLILLNIISCSNIQQSGPWPAQVVSIQNFSDDQNTYLMNVIQALNSRAGKMLIVTDSSMPNNFPIMINIVTENSENANRAGLAIMNGMSCTIQLSEKLFSDEYFAYFEPVVWHELGHCAGLIHIPDQEAIMYAIAAPMESYKNYEITNFFISIIKSAHL